MQRHRFEAVSLVFGVLFAGMGLAFLPGDVDVWRLDWSLFWPVALTLAGLLVLASALTGRRDTTEPAAYEDDTSPLD